MLIGIFGPTLSIEDGKRLLAQNETLETLMASGTEIGMVFHIVSSVGVFIRTNSDKNETALELQRKLALKKDIRYDYYFELTNNDNVDEFNKKMDKLFWQAYQKVLCKNFGLTKQKTKVLINKMKEDGFKIPNAAEMAKDLSQTLKKPPLS